MILYIKYTLINRRKPNPHKTKSAENQILRKPNPQKTKPSTTMAKFYDISSIINPGYEKAGYITKEMSIDLIGRINLHVQANQFNIGDILFVGSEYETRQEYGFYMVLPNLKNKMAGSKAHGSEAHGSEAQGSEAQGSEAQGSEYIIGMPIMPVIQEILQKNKVNYTILLKEMKENKEFNYLFFPDDEDEITDIISSYKTYSLID